MQRIFIDFAASPYAVYDAPMPSEEDAVKALTKSFAETGLFFAVCLAETGEMAGYLCLHKLPGDCCDMGYCFHSNYHGQNYAYESARALMRYLKEHEGVTQVSAGTALDNAPSCRLLERLGFCCVSTETLSFHEDSQGRPIQFTGGNFICQL